jgi:hypothetical protein
MINFLFKNFLLDKVEYQKAIQFWNKLIDTILLNNNIKSESILTYKYSNDESFNDGNPIIDRYIKSINKSVRIIQEEVASDKLNINAWIKETELNEITYLELVISNELSYESSLLAEELIREWIVNNKSKDEMEKIIENVIFQVA